MTATGCQGREGFFAARENLGSATWRAEVARIVPLLSVSWTVAAEWVDFSSVTVRAGSPSLTTWQGVGSSTERAFEAHMNMLAQVYEFRDPHAVRAFLRSNRSLVPLLQSARAKIGEWFTDSGLRVTLQVIDDPDDRAARRLAAYIHTGLQPADALAQLDRFDDWWIEASQQADYRIVVDLEYLD
jgi:hypothetical protein